MELCELVIGQKVLYELYGQQDIVATVMYVGPRLVRIKLDHLTDKYLPLTTSWRTVSPKSLRPVEVQ